MCTSFKQELLQAGHCFNATLTAVSTNITLNSTAATVASTAGMAVGMAAAGTGIAANTVIAQITSTTAITLSIAATATNAAASLTYTADVFKMLLIKVTPTRTFDATQTNVGTPGAGAPSATNVGTDETSGTGYTSGGTTLVNVTPSIPSGTTAITNFSPNPSWTSASFSCTAGIIYNSSTRLGAAAAPLNGRSVSVHDFGGTQTVTSGTFTVLMPTADATNAILRIQ